MLLLGAFSQSAHAEGSNWWRTPEQQARDAYENGKTEQLKGIAPDDAWRGVAAHESGDYENAAQLFNSVSEQQRLDGNRDAANETLYNRGVSEVRAGQYEEAVQTFDQVLEQNPDFADAQHNRDIAQQLIQQAQQEQQQSGDDQGESSDQSDPSGEQSESSETGEQSSDNQGSEQSQSGDQGEPGEQDSPGDEGQQDDARDDSQAESGASQSQAEQDARDALEAEAQSGAQAGNEEDENDGEPGAIQAEQFMSESEQATEQWLRRIPDDPAGLLRRKLEQSHRTEFPEVRDAPEPW